MARESNNYLIVIGDREPLAWVLRHGKMAFSASRARTARLQRGDSVLIYTTSGCFRKPYSDRGRVIGIASVLSDVVPLDEPVTFGDRAFTAGADLKVDGLAPLRIGVELGALAPQLHAFPISERWSVYLRRPLVPLDAHDFGLLRSHLTPLVKRPEAVTNAYLQEARGPSSLLG